MKGPVQSLWWLPVVCLLCSVALAARKETVRGEPVGTGASCEYDAFLKLASFSPSADQKKALESLFGQLKERHITIKPTLYKLLVRADREELIHIGEKERYFSPMWITPV